MNHNCIYIMTAYYIDDNNDIFSEYNSNFQTKLSDIPNCYNVVVIKNAVDEYWNNGYEYNDMIHKNIYKEYSKTF